jgi:hypothetical protein
MKYKRIEKTLTDRSTRFSTSVIFYEPSPMTQSLKFSYLADIGTAGVYVLFCNILPPPPLQSFSRAGPVTGTAQCNDYFIKSLAAARRTMTNSLLEPPASFPFSPFTFLSLNSPSLAPSLALFLQIHCFSFPLLFPFPDSNLS